MEERLQSEGAIFTNDYKDRPNQPDWTGTVTMTKQVLKELVTRMKNESLSEVELRVALWDRTGQKPPHKEYKFARLDVPRKEAERRPPQNPTPPAPQSSNDDFDDDIPF
jgi:hypothetical protein|tara:strand:- start:360 stop:686 length:327 start_codon:yes stop_codon:yes gene_type:complete